MVDVPSSVPMEKQTWRDLGEDKEVVKRDNNVLNKWSKWKVESHYHQLCEHGTTWHDIQEAEKVCQLGGSWFGGAEKVLGMQLVPTLRRSQVILSRVRSIRSSRWPREEVANKVYCIRGIPGHREELF